MTAPSATVPAVDVHDEVVQAAGLRWHLRRCGTGDAIVLLHGTGGTARTWDALLPFLAPPYQLVALDLPGHGGTSFPGFARITCDGLSDMVSAALLALGLAPAAIVAHSAGAAIMLQMASRGACPTTTRLIGINPALEVASHATRALLQGAVGDVLRSTPIRSLVRRITRAAPLIELLLASTGSRLDASQEHAYVEAFRSGAHAEAAYAMMANWDLRALRQALPRISHRTLFIVGDRDRWIRPAIAREAAREMPRARVVEVPGAGHLVQEERAAAVAALIAEAARRGGD